MLIKNARVINPESGFDKVTDILIKDGKIAEIAENIITNSEDTEDVIDAKGLVAAPGLVDVHVHFRDPGFTAKEDINTGATAAAAGGFTTVVCMANTKPVGDNVETLKYILDKGSKTGINVTTVCTVTKGMAGKELTDFNTLYENGAVGFSDDGVPIMDAALLKMAMEKAVELDVPISLHEEAPEFIDKQGVNKGKVSKKIGYPGASALSEDFMVARDCMIALHTGAKCDIQHISSKNAVEMVRTAKKLGANIYAEATPQHFSLTEEIVLKTKALARVNPPIRTEEDRQAIIQGLKDGTIDMIATDHAPHTSEEKAKAIEEAPSGMIGLETALALGITNLVKPGHLTLMELLKKMTVNPAKLYKFDAGSISVGKPADIVLFDENKEWEVKEFVSKASNSPFIGMTLTGKVVKTICGGKIVYESGR